MRHSEHSCRKQQVRLRAGVVVRREVGDWEGIGRGKTGWSTLDGEVVFFSLEKLTVDTDSLGPGQASTYRTIYDPIGNSYGYQQTNTQMRYAHVIRIKSNWQSI